MSSFRPAAGRERRRVASRAWRRRGPFEVLQASVFPGNRLESAILLLMAVAGPIMFFLVGLALAFPGIVLMAISVIPTAALEAVIAFRNRHLWPAQEVLAGSAGRRRRLARDGRR